MYTVLGTCYLGHIHLCAIQEPQVSDTDRLFTMLPMERHSQTLRRGYQLNYAESTFNLV